MLNSLTLIDFAFVKEYLFRISRTPFWKFYVMNVGFLNCLVIVLFFVMSERCDMEGLLKNKCIWKHSLNFILKTLPFFGVKLLQIDLLIQNSLDFTMILPVPFLLSLRLHSAKQRKKKVGISYVRIKEIID